MTAARWNYHGVERQIFATIWPHLPDGSWRRAPKALPAMLNFALGIRTKADVLMSHGAADKLYLFMRDDTGERMINRFRHVFVPGTWLKERLSSAEGVTIPASNIHIVGWPRLDPLVLKQREVDERRARFSRPRPHVLWAPTHDFRKRGPEQDSTSTFPAFRPYLTALQKHCNVSVSLHPRNRWFKTPTEDLMIDADIVVSDFGTMVYEAWALGKPVIFPRWILADRVQTYLPGSAEAHIFEHRIGLHPNSPEEMLEMIQSRPSVDVRVKDFLESYMPAELLGKSGAEVARTLVALA